MSAHYVLGINVGFHDAAAALLGDGRIVNLVEQEKVSRRKHAVAQSPALAIKHCLGDAGVGLGDIAQIAIGWDIPATAMGRSRRFQPDRLAEMLFGELALDAEVAMAHARRIEWVDHHMAHAASAYFSLGAEVLADGTPTAILVIDGAGEHSSTTLAVGVGSEVRVLEQLPIDQSLGFYYSAATRWAGLGDFGEGKLMGLASYGRATRAPGLNALPAGYVIERSGQRLRTAPQEGMPELMMNQFPAFEAAISQEFGAEYPYGKRSGEGVIAYANFAASVQHGLEAAVLGTARRLAALTRAKRLVIAGGVAMNCSMIGRLLRENLFERIYVPPVPTDVGVSLGAALWVARDKPGFSPVLVDHAAWSLPLQEDAEFARVLQGLQLAAVPLHAAAGPQVAARAIANGCVVGWAQGRAEIGERALGSRSIVADPRSRASLERLNRVKGREMWRPVAPSVQRERYREFFVHEAHDPMRFMLAADHVRAAVRSSVPAITHVDGTARPQVVDQRLLPAYWELIDRFREATGVGMVTNTSFNLADEPIVCTAADAARTLARSEGLDLVIAGGVALSKSRAVLDAAVGVTESLVV